MFVWTKKNVKSSIGGDQECVNKIMGDKMKNVIKISILTIMVVAFVLLLIGNKPTDADQSGFLSDYSRLQKQSSNSM